VRQLDGPGSETRLRAMQARFRAVRSKVERRDTLRSAKPLARDFLLYFAAFVAVGVVVWRLFA